MKILISFISIIVLFSCKKEVNAVYKKPQKGDIYIHVIASLEGNISYNANPNANPNLVYMRPLYSKNEKLRNDKIAEKEIYKQNYFKDSVLDIRKLKDNIISNHIYFLDDKKTVKFFKIIDENYEVKFKVQKGNEISIFNYGYYFGIDGVELIDLNKDGIKDILVLQEGYVSNNFLYNFTVYSAVH